MDNPHKVVGFNLNKLIFINLHLNARMVGLKTDIDIDNRHGPKSDKLLCPTESGTAAPPIFQHMYIVAKRSPISANAELLLAENT